MENNNDIVLSSRIRLSRNIPNFNFSPKLSEAKSRELVNYLKKNILQIDKNFKYVDLLETSQQQKQILVDKHLISPELAMSTIPSAVILNGDENVSIMLNEEDHLKIQTILDGFTLEEAWRMTDSIDNLINDKIEYSFNNKIGYLTCCPSNVGTGMKASIMIHLPALNILGAINNILDTISKLRVSVRGLYGEGSEALGNVYQISNQVSLGVSELEIVGNIEAISKKVIEQEQIAREKILKNRNKIEDRVYRAYGIFSNARAMSFRECAKLVSDIRLGVDLGIINEIDNHTLTNVMNMNSCLGDKDIVRAEKIRRMIKNEL